MHSYRGLELSSQSRESLTERYVCKTTDGTSLTVQRLPCIDPEDAHGAMTELQHLQHFYEGSSAFVPIYDIFQFQDDDICWVYPKYPDGVMWIQEQIKKKVPFPLQTVVTSFYTFARGLKLMHDAKLHHGAISTHNILIINDKPRFSGFLLFHHTTMNVSRKSNPYCAPEIDDISHFTKWADVYSLGAVYYEFLSFKTWKGQMIRSNIPDIYPKVLVDLIERMTDDNVLKRPNASDIAIVLRKLNPIIESLHLPADIVYLIGTYIHPTEYTVKILSSCKYYRSLDVDHLWKFYFENWTFYNKDWTPKEYGYRTYRELFCATPLHFKPKSKGIVLGQNSRFIYCDVELAPSEIRFAISLETIPSGHKGTVRIRFNENRNGCFVGVINTERLPEVIKQEKIQIDSKYIRIMRDGSVGGMRLGAGEKVTRTKHIKDRDGVEKLLRVFYKITQGDILTLHIDTVNHFIQYTVNDNPESTMYLRDLLEFKKQKPIHILFGCTRHQSFTILSNTRKQGEPKQKDIIYSCSV